MIIQDFPALVELLLKTSFLAKGNRVK